MIDLFSTMPYDQSIALVRHLEEKFDKSPLHLAMWEWNFFMEIKIWRAKIELFRELERMKRTFEDYWNLPPTTTDPRDDFVPYGMSPWENDHPE